uniref:Uncharacterized protein n=1 Tax=Amphimedon queenslandica TaxID=400682 RepID=A0A1X7UNI5_AMPQE
MKTREGWRKYNGSICQVNSSKAESSSSLSSLVESDTESLEQGSSSGIRFLFLEELLDCDGSSRPRYALKESSSSSLTG